MASSPPAERERWGEKTQNALCFSRWSVAVSVSAHIGKMPCFIVHGGGFNVCRAQRDLTWGKSGPRNGGEIYNGEGKRGGHRSQIPAPCAIPLCLSFNQHQPCWDLASIFRFMSGDSDQWISLSPRRGSTPHSAVDFTAVCPTQRLMSDTMLCVCMCVWASVRLAVLLQHSNLRWLIKAQLAYCTRQGQLGFLWCFVFGFVFFLFHTLISVLADTDVMRTLQHPAHTKCNSC